MSGASIRELKVAVLKFVEMAEALQGLVGVTQFGGRTGLVVSMTNRYQAVRAAVNNLTATGGTPMAEGLIAALPDLLQNGRFLSIEGITIAPRLILMTDGFEFSFFFFFSFLNFFFVFLRKQELLMIRMLFSLLPKPLEKQDFQLLVLA
jgi:hypothetical protein